jgi:type IV secretory pathway VirD2 relaxase
MVAMVRAWEKSDELMWRLILSPEDDDRMNLRGHVRELVSETERALETKLQWVVIDNHEHRRTHVHLLVRGVTTARLSRDRSGVRAF